MGSCLTLMFSVFYEKILGVGVVLRKFFSNKIIVTPVAQGLPSSLLSRPVACVSSLLFCPCRGRYPFHFRNRSVAIFDGNQAFSRDRCNKADNTFLTGLGSPVI